MLIRSEFCVHGSRSIYGCVFWCCRWLWCKHIKPLRCEHCCCMFCILRMFAFLTVHILAVDVGLQRTKGFLKRNAPYKSTFYLLTRHTAYRIHIIIHLQHIKYRAKWPIYRPLVYIVRFITLIEMSRSKPMQHERGIINRLEECTSDCSTDYISILITSIS